MTITIAPDTRPSPTPRRRRSRWWWLVLLWPGLVLFTITQATWQGFDVYQSPFHGLDTRARDLAGQEWTLDPTASDESNYWVTGLRAGDTVKTWTDVSQDGHFGISTRIDSIADPVGPVDLVDVTVTEDAMGNVYPPNGSPIGNTSQLPTTLKPGSTAAINLTWSVTSCHAPSSRPTTYSVSAVQVHEAVLGIHRTRSLPLGYTLHLVEPACATN
ncbi:MAG: hypothetical protein WAN48_09525 [Actinomycetes bacterium]